MAESMADGCTFVQHYFKPRECRNFYVTADARSAKRPPLRIIDDALRQLAGLSAALLKVVPEFLQGVKLAGGVGN